MTKTLDVTDEQHLRENVPDMLTHGNTDIWHLLAKASSRSQGWMKSTKVFEIPGAGCLVQVSTQQHGQVAEALTFVPGCGLAKDGRSLILKWAERLGG